MSKLQFRARTLDASKPMPIYMTEELPELPDFSAINRAVPQMPTGMEKEEESEHHLQRAMVTGLIIPTPEVFTIEGDTELYETLYPADYKMPKQLIHMQPFLMEQDVPEYDMDSEDEIWVNEQSKKMDLTPLKFEEMMDRLEKNCGQKVLTIQEAKILLKEDDELIMAVFDYWLSKRLRVQSTLVPQVRTEQRLGPGSVTNNPYLAFRRRTEKMQTRKNRKNDESSYEKMLKLKRDLTRTLTLIELCKKREKYKREQLRLGIEIYEKRYQLQDFSGQIMAEMAALKPARPAFAQLFNQYNNNWAHKPPVVTKEEVTTVRKEKRQYKKRNKHRTGTSTASGRGSSLLESTTLLSSEDEGAALSAGSPSELEEDLETEGPYAFRRKKLCNYAAPLATMGNWPWCGPEEGGSADPRYRYTLTSIATPSQRCIGFARRRVGRGGRVILDRASTSLDDYWSSLDYTIVETAPRATTSTTPDLTATNLPEPVPSTSQQPEEISRPPTPSDAELLNVFTSEWLHFKPPSPFGSTDDYTDCPLLFDDLDLVMDIDNPSGSWTDNNTQDDPSLVYDSNYFGQQSSLFNVLDASSFVQPQQPSPSPTPPQSSCVPVPNEVQSKPCTSPQRLALKDRINQFHPSASHNGPHIIYDGVKKAASTTLISPSRNATPTPTRLIRTAPTLEPQLLTEVKKEPTQTTEETTKQSILKQLTQVT